MPYSRQQPKIAANGRIGIRLSPEQRDLLMRAPEVPRGLGHLLHRAPVRKGRLELRVTRDELDCLIAGAARTSVTGRQAERELNVFLGYLEDLADRFAEPEDAM